LGFGTSVGLLKAAYTPAMNRCRCHLKSEKQWLAESASRCDREALFLSFSFSLSSRKKRLLLLLLLSLLTHTSRYRIVLSNQVGVDGFPRVLCAAQRSILLRKRKQPIPRQTQRTIGWFTLSAVLEENAKRRPGILPHLTSLGRFRQRCDSVRFACGGRFRASSRRLSRRGSRGCFFVSVSGRAA